MPTSLLAMWHDAILPIINASPRPCGFVVDVGPGWGKAPALLREFVPSFRNAVGVEAWAPYIDDHHLDAVYDLVIRANFIDMPATLCWAADTILMVDVIEHMPKPDALEGIARCHGQVIICTPVYFAHTVEWPPTEAHVSHWHPSDFATLTDRRVEAVAMVHDGWVIRLGPILEGTMFRNVTVSESGFDTPEAAVAWALDVADGEAEGFDRIEIIRIYSLGDGAIGNFPPDDETAPTYEATVHSSQSVTREARPT